MKEIIRSIKEWSADIRRYSPVSVDADFLDKTVEKLEALADENKRLTTENAELRSGEYLVKVIEERERLRKALEPFSDKDGYVNGVNIFGVQKPNSVKVRSSITPLDILRVK